MSDYGLRLQIQSTWNAKDTENGFYLFSKDLKCETMNNKYLCEIFQSAGKKAYYVAGKPPVGNIEDLQKQIDEYVSSLKYNSDYYFPYYRKGMFEELIINAYLHSLGYGRNIKHSSLGDYNKSVQRQLFVGIHFRGSRARGDKERNRWPAKAIAIV